MARPKDLQDVVRKVGQAGKALQPKPVKLMAPLGKELSRPIGSLKPRGLSVGAEDSLGRSPFNRRLAGGGALGARAPIGGAGSKAFSGRSRIKGFR